jgi:hypothetical protein
MLLTLFACTADYFFVVVVNLRCILIETSWHARAARVAVLRRSTTVFRIKRVSISAVGSIFWRTSEGSFQHVILKMLIGLNSDLEENTQRVF